MALTAQQTQIARLLYHLAVNRGISPQHAREFVNAAYEESGLNPGINNRQGSGASGLFQLLSSGYRQKAQQLGGVYNPRANALAILPDYQRYWQQHPNAAPGEAGAAVERSGQGAGFYSRHLGFFNQLGGGAPAAAGPAPGNPPPAAAPVDLRPQIAQTLISQVGQRPNVAPIFDLVHQQAQQPQPVAPATTDVGQGAAQRSTAPLGDVHLAPGADRPSTHTSAEVLHFVAEIAGLYGRPLTIGTGTQHSKYTVNGRVSDHWSGHAADIPARGAILVRLGQLALIAAGANPAWARKQRGGLYNIGGHQIIFNTHLGGDHTNHLHVSAH